MSEKRYPVSEYKLSQLKEAGVFPSIAGPVAVTAWASIVFSFFILLSYFFSNALTQYTDLLTSISAPFAKGELPQAILDFSFLALGFLFAILCFALIASILVAALFNRQLFSFSRFSFFANFSSLRQVAKPGSIIKRGLFGLFLNILVLASSFALVVHCLSIFREQAEKNLSFFFSSSMIPREVVFSSVHSLFTQGMSCLAVLLLGYVLISLLQRVFAVFVFKKQHGMTREELLAEAKETEMSPELRQQMQDSYVGD